MSENIKPQFSEEKAKGFANELGNAKSEIFAVQVKVSHAVTNLMGTISLVLHDYVYEREFIEHIGELRQALDALDNTATALDILQASFESSTDIEQPEA